nr:glycoside hydrolase family 3 protein [Olsenella profusa]
MRRRAPRRAGQSAGGSRRPTARRVGRVVAGGVAVVAVAGLAAATVAMALLGDTVKSYLGTDVVDVTQEERDATMAAGRALAERVEAEGMVLVRNEDETLPLPADVTQVNVFGWASTQWVGSGSGSGQVTGQVMGLLDALSERGVSYNTELTDMYRSFHGERAYKAAGALNSRATEFCRLYEPRITDRTYYTDDLLANAKAYSDTAIVAVGRVSGESVDCPDAQYKVNERGGAVDVDVTRGYLELSAEEEALLRYVGATYEHVVVVVNSTNVMELGELETIPGIDAALLAGPTGEVGARAVVSALWGDVNPSGRTTDTYAYDFSTAASWANSGVMGEGIYTNGQGLYPADGTLNANVGVTETFDAVRFVDYAEGVYVGYRWYETADVEGFWDDVSNEHGTGYDAVVQYPFGYGLSYTDFSWEVVGRSHADGAWVGRTSEVSLTVRVTNTGQVAGRDVVELYCAAPYTPGGIEKPAATLVAFQKTRLLQPGESQDVTVSFSLDDVASYDCYDANGNGFAGYELEAGDYAVELRRDAHTLDACAGARTVLHLPGDIQCADDLATGAAVENRFTGEAAVDGVSVDGSDSGAGIEFLSRADFAGTFPRTGDADRTMTDNVAALNLYGEQDVEADALSYADHLLTDYYQPTLSSGRGTWQLGENGELTDLGRELGADYGDPRWEIVLDQVSVRDMERLVLHGYLATASIDGIGKPLTKEVDGPAQVGSFNQLSYGVGYPAPMVLSQTWNADLAREYGRQLGLEAAMLGVDGLYAPCANLHRTPVGGRNYEYFSEDPLVCGTMAAEVVGGAADSGTYCFLKHFAVNNQDSYRDSLYTWLTEQALRELYLRPFRIAVEEGGATGLMTAYNRVGAVWAGGSKALLTCVLRGEWGFEGAVITDYADHQRYMNVDQMLRAGGDLFMDGVFRNGSFAYGMSQEQLSAARGTPNAARATSYLTNLRRATKDVLYVWLSAREANLSYNESAAEAGAPQIERPVKREGFNYVGTALALADAVAATAVAVRAHRALERRRARRA